MDYERLFKEDAFKSINPQVLENFKVLVKNIQGKSINESMMSIMTFYSSIPKDVKLSKEESEALIQAILVNLSSDDRKKFLKTIDLINNLM